MMGNQKPKTQKAAEAAAPAARVIAQETVTERTLEVDEGVPNRARIEQTRAPTRMEPVRYDPRQFNFGGEEGASDDLHVPQHLIPEGYTVEWKRASIYGQADKPSHLRNLQRNGWEFATMEHFAELMPDGWTGDTIERDGMILMMRPKEITDMSRAYARREATNQVSDKIRQLSQTNEGELDRTAPNLRRSHAPNDVDG